MFEHVSWTMQHAYPDLDAAAVKQQLDDLAAEVEQSLPAESRYPLRVLKEINRVLYQVSVGDVYGGGGGQRGVVDLQLCVSVMGSRSGGHRQCVAAPVAAPQWSGARWPSHSPCLLAGHCRVKSLQVHGFKGNTDDYYNPDNSCINRVLETKQGEARRHCCCSTGGHFDTLRHQHWLGSRLTLVSLSCVSVLCICAVCAVRVSPQVYQSRECRGKG